MENEGNVLNRNTFSWLWKFTANIIGAIAMFIYMMTIDWRVGLWQLICIPAGFIAFAIMMSSSPKYYPAMIIAHRMRTIANADHIVVLGDGVVAEQGSPESLSGYDSIFACMTAQQLISQNWKM